MGAKSRNKGKRGEQEVARLLRAAGYDVARSDQTAGAMRCDVDGPGLPAWIEVKRGKLVNVRAAYRQACNDTDGREPMVAWRDDRGEWMGLMKLEPLVRLLRGL